MTSFPFHGRARLSLLWSEHLSLDSSVVSCLPLGLGAGLTSKGLGLCFCHCSRAQGQGPSVGAGLRPYSACQEVGMESDV